MQPARVHSLRLTPHPETRSAAVHRVDVRVSRRADGTLHLTYMLHADLERLRIPPHDSARMADRLWQHTCFEMFLRREDAPAYHEFNLSSSGAWAVYAFEGYRDGAPLAEPALEPLMTVRQSAGVLELDAAIRLELISALHANAKLSMAISAIIEDSAGALSYWALRHPPGKPDFHHSDGYALELTADGSGMTTRSAR